MHHSGRGIRVTLTAAALTALVAVAAVPSVFAIGTLAPVSNLAGTAVGVSVPAVAGPVVTFNVVTKIPAPASPQVNAVDIAFPSGTVLPTSGWTFNGLSATAYVSGSNVQVQWPYAFDAIPVYIGVAAGSITNPPVDGPVTISTWYNATGGTIGSGTEYDAGSVDMGLVAATCPTGTIYGAGGYLSACPATLPADGTSRSTVTVNTANLGTLTGTLVLTTSVNSGTFVGPVTVTSGAGAWNPTPSVTSTIVTGTKPTGTGTSTLSLQAPTTNGSSVLQLYFTPTGGSQQQLDTLTITYRTPATGQGPFGREHERGARKVAFYATTGLTTCAAAPIMPTSGAARFGFAVVNSTGNGRLNIEVSLKGVAPGTYNVYVDQAGTCGSTALTLRTNSRGNGNRHISVPSTGAGQVWLTAVQTAGGSNVFVTTAGTVVVKGHAPKDHGNGKDNPGRGRGHD